MDHILNQSSCDMVLLEIPSVQIHEIQPEMRNTMSHRLSSLGIYTWDGWMMIRNFLPPND